MGTILVVAFVLALAAAILLVLWMGWRRRAPEPPARRRPTPVPEAPGREVPDAVAPERLAPLLTPRLVGDTLDGTPAPSAPAVVWVDGGDEVVVHLDSLAVAVDDGVLLVRLDLETDETGRATLVVAFAVGEDEDGGVLLTTEDRPRGPDVLVARWGDAVIEAAHAAVLDLAATHAAERGGAPRALYAKGGALRFVADAP